jgi:hypothetical protein
LSNRSPLQGYIIEFYNPYRDVCEKYHTENMKILSNLPEDDEFPALTKNMFMPSGISESEGGSRSERAIFFGGYYNHILSSLPKWLDKFELLLKSLYWHSATIYIDGGWDCANYTLEYSIDPPSDFVGPTGIRDLYRYFDERKESIEHSWKLKVMDRDHNVSKDSRLLSYLGASRITLE